MNIFRLLTMILGLTFSACAMQKAFDEALKVGTKKAIEQCVVQHTIDLNSRCLTWKIPGMSERVVYPLEYVFHKYHRGSSIKNLFQILIDLGVPIDGYDDYNPLLHAVNLHNDDLIKILLELGADSRKHVPSRHSTPLQQVEKLLEEEKNARVKKDLAWLQEIQKLFLSSPVTHKGLGDTNVSKAFDTSSDVLKRADKILLSTHETLTYRQVTVVAGIAFVCGVVCTKYGERLYDWCYCSDKDDSVDTDEQSKEI